MTKRPIKVDFRQPTSHPQDIDKLSVKKVNARKGVGVDQPGNGSARHLRGREKARTIRESNKRKQEEAAAKTRERAAASAAAAAEEGEEDVEECDSSPETIQVVEKN